jgi:uncharacterized protein YxjI
MGRYTIRKKLIALGRSYSVSDDQGQEVCRVRGKIRFATTFDVIHPGGLPVKVREKLLALDPTFVLTRDGRQVAVVRRTSHDVAPYRFSIDVEDEQSMSAEGTFFSGSAIRLERSGQWLASLALVQGEIVHETFVLNATAGLDEALLIAIAVCFMSVVTYRGEHLG